MKRFIHFSIITLLFSFLSVAAASARTWELDRAHTNFYFSVDHIFSKVRGHFNDYTGEVAFDPADLANSSLKFVIKVDSIDTNEPKRDKHLRSADFFDSDKYPLMTFTSTKITALGDGKYAAAGKFNVKGQDYDLTLPFTLAGIKPHPMAPGKDVIGLNGGLVIDRLQYKIGSGKFYKLGIVGKDVDILVTVEGLSDKR